MWVSGSIQGFSSVRQRWVWKWLISYLFRHHSFINWQSHYSHWNLYYSSKHKHYHVKPHGGINVFLFFIFLRFVFDHSFIDVFLWLQRIANLMRKSVKTHNRMVLKASAKLQTCPLSALTCVENAEGNHARPNRQILASDILIGLEIKQYTSVLVPYHA